MDDVTSTKQTFNTFLHACFTQYAKFWLLLLKIVWLIDIAVSKGVLKKISYRDWPARSRKRILLVAIHLTIVPKEHTRRFWKAVIAKREFYKGQIRWVLYIIFIFVSWCFGFSIVFYNHQTTLVCATRKFWAAMAEFMVLSVPRR